MNTNNVKLYKARATKKFNGISNNQELWVGKTKNGYYLVLSYMMLTGTSQPVVLHEDSARLLCKTLRVNKQLVRDTQAEKLFNQSNQQKAA